MTALLKNLAAYQLVKLLSTSFDKWPAFKHGLIDKDGETLKKPSTKEEKSTFGMFQRLVRRIKQLIIKAPFGALKLASLAVALKLLKEEIGHDLTEELEQFGITNKLINEHSANYTQSGLICQDKYISESGNIFIIKEDADPIDNILGINIYEVFDVVSRERILVTELDITRV